ncbi:MAG: DUF2256 domain-containing protein [Chthoniobacterales bacterium]
MVAGLLRYADPIRVPKTLPRHRLGPLVRRAWAMRGVKKQHLPEKICPICGRHFVWRKKWEKVWNEVRFCSERCRRTRPSGP